MATKCAGDFERACRCGAGPSALLVAEMTDCSPAFIITVNQHVIPGMQADAGRLFCEARYRPHDDERA